MFKKQTEIQKSFNSLDYKEKNVVIYFFGIVIYRSKTLFF